MDDGGIGRLERRFAAIPKNVKEAVQPTLQRQAKQMAATMRRLAPEDSGDLKNSIAITPGGSSTPAHSQPGGSSSVASNQVAVTAGNDDVRYAHLVEYGHKASGFSAHDVPAKPFFWPAVRLHRKKATRAIKSAIGRAVKKHGGAS